MESLVLIITSLRSHRLKASCTFLYVVAPFVLFFQLPPYRLEEPVITKDVYEVAVSLIQMFDDLDMKESG